MYRWILVRVPYTLFSFSSLSFFVWNVSPPTRHGTTHDRSKSATRVKGKHDQPRQDSINYYTNSVAIDMKKEKQSVASYKSRPAICGRKRCGEWKRERERNRDTRGSIARRCVHLLLLTNKFREQDGPRPRSCRWIILALRPSSHDGVAKVSGRLPTTFIVSSYRV